MLVGTRRIADFCRIIGQVKKGDQSYWVCRIHGRVEIVPYFGRATGPMEWACPECIAMHLNCTLAHAVRLKKVAGTVLCCEFKDCTDTNNLENCEQCGDLVCPSHRIEGVCSACYATESYLHSQRTGSCI
jgi:hypothetical protein